MFFTKAYLQILKKNCDDIARLFTVVDFERRGITSASLSAWERGKSVPTLNEKIRLLYEHLGLEVVSEVERPAFKIIKKEK